VIVEAAGGLAKPSAFSTQWIFRPPQVGCSVRTASTRASISAHVRVGLFSGRRERSSSPAAPSAACRPSHL